MIYADMEYTTADQGTDGAQRTSRPDVEGTINALATVAISDRDRLTGKVIFNQSDVRLPVRLSFDQFQINPYQRGCEHAATAAPGCGTISVLANGVNGARVAQTAAEGDLGRDDRRTIIGVRWEHDMSGVTTWRTQAVFDSRVISQPTSAFPLVTFVGVSYAYLDIQSYAFNKTPAGRDSIGAAVQTVLGNTQTVALRAREELSLTPKLHLVAGVGAERSTIDAGQVFYLYQPDTDAISMVVPASRRFTNVAPEASLVWQADPAVRLHARVGTAYGIP